MDDVRLGQLLRAARIRRRWRQQDVATRAGVSRTVVSDLECGLVRDVRVSVLRTVATVLEVQIDLVARFRGGEGERLVSARHAALAEAVTRYLQRFGWVVRPEVSFSIYGERGLIDLLAWHEARQALLIVELKTEIVDVGELLGTFDRKQRLAPRIAKELGLKPEAVSAWAIVAGSPANRRRVARHAALIRAALPGDGRTLRGWLRNPTGSAAGLAFMSFAAPGGIGSGNAPVRRVHVRQTTTGPTRSSVRSIDLRAM